MAVINITEYATLGVGVEGARPMAKEPRVTASQEVAVGAGSLQSAAFNIATRFIRVQADVVAAIRIDTNPTAVATDYRMAANQTEFIAVEPGHKLAAITRS